MMCMCLKGFRNAMQRTAFFVSIHCRHQQPDSLLPIAMQVWRREPSELEALQFHLLKAVEIRV